MPDVDRRRFLTLAGGTAALSALTPSIARAASIPANRATGTIQDVEHIVVLMQENRSFDHYLGTLNGVRGFGDPHPAVLPNGSTVWRQPDGRPGKKGDVLPFRPDHAELGDQFLEDLSHAWIDQHAAFNAGRFDNWLKAKNSTTTMAHLERGDVPFHYQLADAFTVCDSYHCSTLSSTNPNRYYLWSGWVGNDGKGGGPVVTNVFDPAHSWTTYPERLTDAGVTWKIYQDVGFGLDATNLWGDAGDVLDAPDPSIGNYGDNSLLYFSQYQDANPGDDLHISAFNGTQIAGSGTLFDQLKDDVTNDKLPQVSWIVAPEAYTEHPNWPPNYGSWYVSKALEALTSNPEVWSKTALFLTYDENDGFFDHVVPPYPNVGKLAGASTVSLANELYQGPLGAGPYGLGIRVPMTVISPWSTGGWVCSEVFDHTSIIRFMEQRFGVREPNITPWRRAVCGDLTSAFDFAGTGSVPTPSYNNVPANLEGVPFKDSYRPVPPKDQRLPKQESGTRPSRALGYRLQVDLKATKKGLELKMGNTGRLGAHLQARSNTLKGGPFSYTIGAGHTLERTLKAKGRYDVSLHGPNGFFRRFSGKTDDRILEVTARRGDGRLVLTLHNRSKKTLTVKVADAHRGTRIVKVAKKSRKEVKVALGSTHGWYDVLVTVAGHSSYRRALAGRFDNGQPSTSDPLLSR